MANCVKNFIKWGVVFCMFIPTLARGKDLSEGLPMDRIPSHPDDILIYPVQHASFVIEIGVKAIYIDPVGDKSLYSNYPKPDLILMTDIHGDHLSLETIHAIKTERTVIVAPLAVSKQLPGCVILQNGDRSLIAGFKLEAIAMYNTTKGRLQYHPQGRGNGYVVTLQNKRIYRLFPFCEGRSSQS